MTGGAPEVTEGDLCLHSLEKPGTWFNGPQTAFLLTYTGVLKLIIKGREVVIYMLERVKVLLVFE